MYILLFITFFFTVIKSSLTRWKTFNSFVFLSNLRDISIGRIDIIVNF